MPIVKGIFNILFTFEQHIRYYCCVKEKKSFEILELAENNNGYISVKEAQRFSISQEYLVLAEEAGQFVKAARGLYVKKGYPLDPYYILQFTYKKAVFSLSSALYLHELCDADPKITVNLPRGYMNKGIPNTTSKHLNEKDFYLGQSLIFTNYGHIVTTYDLERAFIDAYRHRDELKINMKDIFLKAQSKGLDKEKLRIYAKELKTEEAIEAFCSLL